MKGSGLSTEGLVGFCIVGFRVKGLGFRILRVKRISVTFNLILISILTGAGAPQLCRRARTPRKRACATLGAF